jgi:hypothetical protein
MTHRSVFARKVGLCLLAFAEPVLAMYQYRPIAPRIPPKIIGKDYLAASVLLLSDHWIPVNKTIEKPSSLNIFNAKISMENGLFNTVFEDKVTGYALIIETKDSPTLNKSRVINYYFRCHP